MTSGRVDGQTRPRWAGADVKKARAWVGPHLPSPCSRCGDMVLPTEEWDVDHIPSRSDLPPEEWGNPTYWHAAHRRCNQSAGGRAGNRRKAAARRTTATRSTAKSVLYERSDSQCVGDAVALRRRLAQSEARALAAETRANNIAGNIAATIRMRIGAPRVWWRVSHLVNEALTWAAEVADSYALADDGD